MRLSLVRLSLDENRDQAVLRPFELYDYRVIVRGRCVSKTERSTTGSKARILWASVAIALPRAQRVRESECLSYVEVRLGSLEHRPLLGI